jgi:hypothetical protein
MLKHLFALFAACCLTAAADTVVPRVVWQVETREPTTKRLDLLWDETVDLEVKFLSYARPMTIDGASVIMHGRTNGMAAGTSWQVAGESSTGGLARVRLSPSAWVPVSASNLLYTLEVVQTNSARVLRAYGQALIRGTAAASTNAPQPASVFSNYVTWAALTAATNGLSGGTFDPSVTNGLASVSQLTAATSGLSTVAQLTAATGALASASESSLASATNALRVRAVYDPVSDARWIDGTGGVWQVSNTSSQAWDGVTYKIVLSSDFRTQTDSHGPVGTDPDPTVRVFLVTDATANFATECDEDPADQWYFEMLGGWHEGYRTITHFRNGVASEVLRLDSAQVPWYYTYDSGGNGAPYGTAWVSNHYTTVSFSVTQRVDGVVFASGYTPGVSAPTVTNISAAAASQKSQIINASTNSLGATTNLTVVTGGATNSYFFSRSCDVPRTGQTNVYAALVDDGALLKGRAWPSPRFTIIGTSDATTNQVRDNLTGLIWARDFNPVNNGTNWLAAFTHVTNVLNTAGYGGASDWRMPNRRELESLIHYQYESPALPNTAGTGQWTAGAPFFSVQNGTYWTSTTRIGSTTLAFTIDFVSTQIAQGAKSGNVRFVAVRGP